MACRLIIGDLRVQAVERDGRGRSFTIALPDGAVHEAADRFLRGYDGSGTQRTYAYLLLDHLRWLEREALPPEMVSLQDLKRYMAALGAAWRGPYGQPWREGRRLFGQSALSAAAACVKGFYLHQALLGINPELGPQLQLTRLPSRADRQRAFLGHVQRELPANPLAPPRQRRLHPEAAARRRPGDAAGSGDHRPGPAGGDLAGGRRVPDRRAVRAAPGRPAPARRRGVRAVPGTGMATSATGTATRTGPRPRPSTHGSQRTASSPAG